MRLGCRARHRPAATRSRRNDAGFWTAVLCVDEGAVALLLRDREQPTDLGLDDVGVLWADRLEGDAVLVGGRCLHRDPVGTLRIPVWMRSRRIQRSSVE